MRGCTCQTCEGARAYSRAQRGMPARIATYQKYRERIRSDEQVYAEREARRRERDRARADVRDAARLAEIKERNSQS